MSSVRDVMHLCETVPPTESVAVMVARMAATQTGVLAVVDAAGRLTGLVTEHDLIKLIYQSGRFDTEGFMGNIPAYLGWKPAQLRLLTAADIMTNDPETVAPGTALDEATRLMVRNRRKALLVAEGASLLGIVYRADLLARVLG